ncbi:hypothetical protein DL96DRAFT_1619635 [Flagelloscypha sp. PMI_526]|nr:hypothetical protein DL96DRAFT_1619635 [Flagelloscypha sp. PMI_526]
MAFSTTQAENSFVNFMSSEDLDKEWLNLSPHFPPQSLQIPTPPASDSEHTSNVDVPATSSMMTVSTVFYPGAQLNMVQDVVLMSNDGVHFYVDKLRLLSSSYNGFNHFLDNLQTADSQDPPILPVCERSEVLNVVLHAIFHMSCAAYAPSFEVLKAAVNQMPTYGLQAALYLKSSSPLFPLLLAQAPLHPDDVFALAAEHRVEELAVPASSHLLSIPLFKINDEMASRIGPVYLRRLFFMHLGRIEALKRLLKPPPYPHPPSVECDFAAQKSLSRAWTLTAAYIIWDARPDTSTSSIKSAFQSLSDQLPCSQCNKALVKRLEEVIVSWSQIKCTI